MAPKSPGDSTMSATFGRPGLPRRRPVGGGSLGMGGSGSRFRHRAVTVSPILTTWKQPAAEEARDFH